MSFSFKIFSHMHACIFLSHAFFYSLDKYSLAPLCVSHFSRHLGCSKLPVLRKLTFQWGKTGKKKKNVSMTNQKIYSISEVATALGEKLKATGEELVSVGAGLASGRLLQADQRCDRFLLSLC